MKVLLNVTLREIPDIINRQIEVDENISLKDLCEGIIISMNGSKIPIYEFEHKNVTYYPYLLKETKKDKSLENLLFKDLILKKGMHFTLNYDFENYYFFDILIDDIYESQDGTTFKVLSGNGYGINDDCDSYQLSEIFNAEERWLRKSDREFLSKIFDCTECNKIVTDYMNARFDRISPKRYVFNVSLWGFDKEIKRKIVVNNNILIADFCRGVILAMNGDLSHLYGIKMGKKRCLSEYYNDFELYYLNIKEKQKLKIIYDWGDNWEFNLTLSKIMEDYGDTQFDVLSGKGYGIIDDVGGVWGLQKVFDGKDRSWGKHNINDFNLEKCRKKVRKI